MRTAAYCEPATGAASMTNAFFLRRRILRGRRSLRVALKPKQTQAVHVLDRRFVLCVFLLEGAVYLGISALVLVECGFGYFAIFGAHHILPVEGYIITPPIAASSIGEGGVRKAAIPAARAAAKRRKNRSN